MKRNLFILALFVAAFCFVGQAVAQDNGVPDTLYLEPWASDIGVTGSGPFFIKVPMLVTNDVVDAVTDSIAGFVIPLCYTATPVTGALDYCSTAIYWNKTSMLTVAPDIDRSIFRHMPDMGTATLHNKMLDMNADFVSGWDFVVLDLGDEVSRFWFTMVPTGTMDQRWGPGSRALMATMTFKTSFEDSIDICIDSCFWPPASRLAYSNSNAETYIPKIWDDYFGTEYFCFRPFIIPDPPPYFSVCPGDETPSTNGSHSSGDFTANDDGEGYAITDISASFSGTGVSGVTVVEAKDTSVTGHIDYVVTDHCTASGTITITVTDGVGQQATCEFDVTGQNNAPTVTCPANDMFTYCDGYAGDAVGADADGDGFTYDISGVPGIQIDANGHITWAPTCQDVGGPFAVVVTVTDDCGATGNCTFNLTVTNDPPSITCPDDAIVTAGSPFVSTDFSFDDDCPGASVSVASVVPATVNAPTIVGSHVEWQTDASEEGGFLFTLQVTDECGLTDECEFLVTVVSYGFSQILIPNSECANPGEYVCLPVLLDNNTTPFGGFELALEYDYTSMTLVDVNPGEAIEGFEYFTYRLLPCPLCGCCKYKILIYGQYDMPNGPESIGDPIPMTPMGVYQTLVDLCFVVNNNENLRGLKIPVCFEWEGTIDPETGCLVEDWNCGENTFSSLTGDTLYTSGLCCQFVADLCDDPGDRVDGKLVFQYGVCGQNCGGVDVCPAGPDECKRGDVNYNYVTYEVADAVLFASYFVEGTSVFRYDMAYQICATDVNADGRTLTLSDLVYLIRVILHDAVEIPKLAPSSEIASVMVTDGVVTTECASQIGALLFEFDGTVTPTLLAGNMEMVANGNKVLVWSRTGQTIQNADVMSYTGAQLVSVQAVDRDSRTLETVITARMTPTAFALHPAYPNPFNPSTNLSFTLPEAASYSMRIYNVAGQLVRSYEGMGSQGLNVITWDGRDNSGSEVSSGIYFYQLTAAGNSATEKMVMMK
jgi:hypothetical protein